MLQTPASQPAAHCQGKSKRVIIYFTPNTCITIIKFYDTKRWKYRRRRTHTHKYWNEMKAKRSGEHQFVYFWGDESIAVQYNVIEWVVWASAQKKEPKKTHTHNATKLKLDKLINSQKVRRQSSIIPIFVVLPFTLLARCNSFYVLQSN